MDEEVTVAEVALFLDHTLPILEKALLYAGVAEDKWCLASDMCISAFLRWFGAPQEIKEQLIEIGTFADDISRNVFSDWHISRDDLSEMREKVDGLIMFFANKYPKAGIWHSRKRRRENIPV